jgi:AcrR family transcriptional regulator
LNQRPDYDAKLLSILREAASVFAEKGYHRASIRDISGATGVSLSGLYYYFSSKEELLFLIQDHCFGTLLSRLEDDLQGVQDPECQLRVLVRNHLHFFVDNMKEMKVLSHEADVLTGAYRQRIQEQKRQYVEALAGILSRLRNTDERETRTAALALFGMMNWIYTWYNPERDPGVEALEERMLSLFLHGYLHPAEEGEGVELPEDSRMGRSSIWRST